MGADQVLTLRCTVEQKEAIKKAAAREGLTITQYLLDLAEKAEREVAPVPDVLVFANKTKDSKIFRYFFTWTEAGARKEADFFAHNLEEASEALFDAFPFLKMAKIQK